MSTLREHIQTLQRIHEHIRRSGTGTPEEFAKRINVTRTTLYRRLDELKAFGAPIRYNKFRGSFYYERPYEFPIKILE